MSYSDIPEPPLPRRGVQRDDPSGEPGAPGPTVASTAPGHSAARRAATIDDGVGHTGPPAGTRRWLAAGVIAMVVVAVLVWVIIRNPGEVTVVLPSASVAATPTTTPSPSVESPISPTPSGTAGSAAPLPGTVPPAPVLPQSPEPSPEGSEVAGTIVLNDATFIAPAGWLLYGDDLIEDGRRAVRLSHDRTDARLQAVTLNPGDSDLSASCGSLVDLQQAQFSDVTRQLVVPIGVEASAGTGVRCGFTGVRSSDGIANTVTFTLVSRATDSHVLMLRTTVPQGGASDSAPVQQLGAMSCEASASFGLALPLC